MSSTPEDGEVEQDAVEEVSVPHTADLQDKTLFTHDDPVQQDGDGMNEDEDVDTIPQLDPPANVGPNESNTREEQGHTSALQPAIQLTATSPSPVSVDDSASIPDDTPSIQDSGLRSPRSDAGLAAPPFSRKSSTASRRPFERRFQSRLSSSYIKSPRASSPAFLSAHSRNSSLASLGHASDSATEESHTPWEVIRWNRLRKLTGQAFSESGRRNFGNPTCLAVSDQIVIGTSKGLILVFDHQQNNQCILGPGTKAPEAGSVTALAISADHTAIAAGHATGHIFTWEINRPTRPFMQIAPIDASQAEARKIDGHVQASAVLHLGFLGYRRTALVSADDRGMAFSHLATRGTGSLARNVRTTRILGRYPELLVRPSSKPAKQSSVLAFAPLPLGNVEQKTDALGLVAMLTPYLLVIVSTTPIAQTQHKAARPKEIAAHSAMTAALAWFPAIRLKGSNANVSRNKLVYAWSNVLSVLEVEEVPRELDTPEDKPVELQFVTRHRYEAEEPVVAVQWLSRSVIAALTITQQLLIIEDVTMNITDAFDLLPKNLYHADLYSHQLQSVIEDHDEDDASMHGVVADAYYMSFRCHKGRLFLLGNSDMWWGSLTNWADRLLAMMETGDFIAAIRLATNYFSGTGEKVTIGLPEDDAIRSALVRDKLLEMMSASLRYAFGKNEHAGRAPLNRQQFVDLAVACVAACLKMDDRDFLFDEVFEWYDENSVGDLFVDVLEPHILDRQITTLPPAAVKTLISHFSKTHAPSQLEEVVCLLDATAMDVDQVTSLCKQHNLYDAYIYVWNTALFDYASPLLELLNLASVQPVMNGHVATSGPNFMTQKIFPYLSFILTSRVYPIGEFMDDERALMAKTQIYETLFYGKSGQKDPFQVLRSMLELDTPSFMAAMNEAFEDSFLNSGQDDVLEGIQGNGASPRGSLFNRQIIVRILLDVMSTGFLPTDRLYLDMFIARNLPKYPQYMLLAGTTMEQIFVRLCGYEDEDNYDDAQLSVEYLMTVYKPANVSAFIPVLQRARFYRILKAVYKQEQEWTELLKIQFDDQDDQGQIFPFLIDVLQPSSDLESDQRRSITDELKNHVDDLARIDISRTAQVIDIVLPEDHAFFIDNLSDVRAQFHYLRTLFEPEQGGTKSSHTTNKMIELYVRLMCQYDSSHVIEYINTVKEGELRLEEVIPALESSGNIDAAVVLLARQGQLQNAMNRLIKHLSAVEAALIGILESAADSPDEVATNEAIEDLLASVDKYAKVGIWLCESQMEGPPSKVRTPSNPPRRPSVKQTLSFEEQLWLEFIIAVVAIAQKVGPGSTQQGHDRSNNVDGLALALRNTIQRVFTALLNSTATARGQAQSDSLRFVRILRAFLSRAAEISPSLSHLRHVMSSIFSAYAYEESLLSLSNSMIDKDLFVQVDEIAKLRQVGWRPRGQVCGICRRRVWGPGMGLKVWESWEKKEKDRSKRLEEHRRLSVHGSEPEDDDVGRGKGKAAASQGVDDDESEESLPPKVQPDMGPIVVFSCRHVFHRKCLLQSQDTERSDDGVQGTGFEGVKLACPTCV